MSNKKPVKMTTANNNKNNNNNNIPQSPFFRPSKPKLVTVTQTVTTPRGTHSHILSQTQLLQTSVASHSRDESSTSSPRTPSTAAITTTTTASACTTTQSSSSSPSQTPISFDVLEAKSSLLGTYANLVNAIVGAGIVGIPYALNQTGLLTGIGLILFVAAMTDKSLRLLIETGKWLHVPSYELLMEALFGRPGFIFISLSMFVMSYGGMICYLLIIKDTLPTLLPFVYSTNMTNKNIQLEAEAVEWMKQMVLIGSSVLIILPLSLQRDMAHLSKTSTLSVLFDILLVGIVVIFSPVQESIQANGGLQHVLLKSTIHPSTLFSGLGVLSFAFVCQDSSFLIAGSLHRPTKARWKIVTRYAMITCTILAIIMGVSGYLAFQSSTDGNILNNFSSTSYLTLSPMTYASTSMSDTTTVLPSSSSLSSSSATSPEILLQRHAVRLLSTNTDPPPSTSTKTLTSDSSHIVSATKIGTGSKSSSSSKYHGSSINNSTRPTSTTRSPTPTLLPSQQWAANIARFLLGTTMFFVYPLASFVCRHVLIVLFFQGPIAREGNDHTVLKRADRRIALTVFLYLAALLPALFCDSVGTILAITGAIGGSCLSYVGPGVAYLGAHGQVFLEMVRERWIQGDLKSPLQLDTDDVEKCLSDQEVKYSVLWMFPGPSVSISSKSISQGTTIHRKEDTPLLSRECSKDSLDISSKSNKNALASSAFVSQNDGPLTYWDIFVWYICCMPLWCTIASIGSRNSQAFIHSQREEQRKDKGVRARSKMVKSLNQPSNSFDPSNSITPLRLNHVPSESTKDILEERVSPTRLLKHTFSVPDFDTHRRNHALNMTIKVGDQLLLVPYPSLTSVRAFVDASYGSNQHSNIVDRRINSSYNSYYNDNHHPINIAKSSNYLHSSSTPIQEKEDDLELPIPIFSPHVNIPRNVLIQEDVMTAVDESDEDTDIDEILKTEIEPSWSDFLLSISYIVLGVVAATAGLLSILSE